MKRFLTFFRDVYIDFLIFIVALIILVLHTYDQRSLKWWIYLCVIVSSLALWVKARIDLGNSFSVQPKADQLISQGLYARIRHPIYLFSTIAAFFWALMAAKWYWFVPIILLILLQIWRARKEEQKMLEKFNGQYIEYKKKTWF